jgi:GT2 family glycosyltransferase
MKIIVIIATYGRGALLARTLAFLEGQSRLPDGLIVSAPDESHVMQRDDMAYPISYVFGERGLCAQRNRALEAALAQGADIVTFFDDDFLPSTDYLRILERAFTEHPGWVVARGEAVADGVSGAGFTFDEGLELLRDAERERTLSPVAPQHSDMVGGYGCNMAIRASAIGASRFDERLPLYGWQEDIDFTSRLRERGKVVGLNALYGVHLGVKSGRVSGIRFGYSQLVNPIYLVRKGTMPTGFAVSLIWRNIAANAVKSLWPEPYIDRRGRLKGNMLAAMDLARGRVDPEHILKL